MARAVIRSRTPLGVWLGSGAVVALLLTVSSRYGFHRDELYFIVAGRRLDWGFVDQPPFTPLVARLAETALGTSPTALRLLPALAIGAVALLTASVSRRLGGGDRAQVFAAWTAAFAGVTLAVGHLLSTVAFDFAFWGVAIWLLVRLLDGSHPREWIWLGAVIGVGLLNKHLIGALAASVLIGLLVSRRRDLLASWWPWAGAVLAALIATPNLAWQAANGWPQLEMAEALAARSDGPAAFVLQQVGLLSITLTVPAAAGLWWLLRSPEAERWRPLGVAFVVLWVAYLATGGKAYYVAPMYPLLLAAGGGWYERLRRRPRRTMEGAAVVGIGAGLFIALPLLPVSSMSAFDATGELGETVGWPELVAQVREVYDSIPEDRRGAATVFTASYGEAGAVDVLGTAVGLPPATSGHNSYWLWGPPPATGPIIGVGPIGDQLSVICPDVTEVGVVSNPWGVENEALGYPLFLCLDPEAPLSTIWDAVRHFN